MHRPTDWSRLRKLAQERRDLTGQRLAEAVAQRDTARQKLEMLVDYRRDYDGRLAQSATGGIDAEKLRSYRQFLANLERAIDEQSDVVALAEDRVARTQAQWRDEQRQVDSFRILDERRVTAETRRAGRAEQRLTDELASRLAAVACGDD